MGILLLPLLVGAVGLSRRGGDPAGDAAAVVVDAPVRPEGGDPGTSAGEEEEQVVFDEPVAGEDAAATAATKATAQPRPARSGRASAPRPAARPAAAKATSTTRSATSRPPATAPPTTRPTTTRPPTTRAPTTTAAPRNTQEGDASWYRWKAGNCAHRTIAFGTVVTVTNLENGRSARCTVGDRGPFVEGRIIDLDATVFEQLAPLSEGVFDARIAW